MNHDQIDHQIHVRNNWLDPIFSSPEDRLLVLHHLGLKGFFLSFKITPHPLMTKFCVFMPVQGIELENS